MFIEDDVIDKSSKSSTGTSAQKESSESVEDIAKIPKTTLTGKPNDKFVDILLKAIEKNNMEGFDYLEYKNSLQSLQNMNMDDATRHNSAYAMAKTMGSDRIKLKASAEYYLTILKQEYTKFQQTLVNQRDRQVQGRKNSLSQTKKSIENKKKTIAQLQSEIDQETKKLATIENRIQIASNKIEQTNTMFVHAYNAVSGQIKNDLKNILAYIKE